jgi:putative phosphoribosyl transferase
MHFLDRSDAGRMLAAELVPLAAEHPVVVALPRGGVPVGAEVARLLGAPLEILAVRKLGAPGNPELGVGAIVEDGTAVLDERSAGAVGMTQEMLDETVVRETAELQRRVERYRAGRARLPVEGRTVIVVDDGLATGLSDLAAVRALRRQAAGRIVVAVPVGSGESVRMLAEEADDVVCVLTPRVLFGVGLWYEDFSPISDEQVLALLREARGREEGDHPEKDGRPEHHDRSQQDDGPEDDDRPQPERTM